MSGLSKSAKTAVVAAGLAVAAGAFFAVRKVLQGRADESVDGAGAGAGAAGPADLAAAAADVARCGHGPKPSVEPVLQDVKLVLEADHLAFLDSVSEKYKISDPSKALRVLIKFAAFEEDKDAVFKPVRCMRCEAKNKCDFTTQLYSNQVAFLEAVAKHYDLPDASKATRVLMDYAISCDEEARAKIFTVIRCTHPKKK